MKARRVVRIGIDDIGPRAQFARQNRKPDQIFVKMRPHASCSAARASERTGDAKVPNLFSDNPWEFFGLEVNASLEALGKAKGRLRHKWHPDRNPKPWSDEFLAQARAFFGQKTQEEIGMRIFGRIDSMAKKLEVLIQRREGGLGESTEVDRSTTSNRAENVQGTDVLAGMRRHMAGEMDQYNRLYNDLKTRMPRYRALIETVRKFRELWPLPRGNPTGWAGVGPSQRDYVIGTVIFDNLDDAFPMPTVRGSFGDETFALVKMGGGSDLDLSNQYAVKDVLELNRLASKEDRIQLLWRGVSVSEEKSQAFDLLHRILAHYLHDGGADVVIRPDIHVAREDFEESLNVTLLKHYPQGATFPDLIKEFFMAKASSISRHLGRFLIAMLIDVGTPEAYAVIYEITLGPYRKRNYKNIGGKALEEMETHRPELRDLRGYFPKGYGGVKFLPLR